MPARNGYSNTRTVMMPQFLAFRPSEAWAFTTEPLRLSQPIIAIAERQRNQVAFWCTANLILF